MAAFLIVDFEFTKYTRPVGRPNGFFPEIIEIGAVKYDAEGNELGSVQNFVKPHFYPKQAKEGMEFCMITEKDMKSAIPFPQMVEKLAALYVPGETWFVAWGGEDYKVLDTGCRRHGLENPILKEDYLDLALAYRLLKGDGYTTGLKKAGEELGTASEGLWHTAYDDAANTGRILFKLIEQGWTPERFEQDKEAAKEQARLKAQAKAEARAARRAGE